MTKTFKMLTTISFIAMAIVLTFVGVWAITDLDFSVGGDITYTAPEPKGPIITMGEYQGEAVEWKLIAVDGQKFNGETLPTSGIGTFIISTVNCIYITAYFHDELEMVEYEDASIRDYLKNEYVSTLNLSSDTTYNKIKARTMKDLAVDAGYNYNGLASSSHADNEVYDKTSTSTESDKLWLLSVKEAYEWLGGGVVGSDNIISDWNTYRENYQLKDKDQAYMSLNYWLRSLFWYQEDPFWEETIAMTVSTDGTLESLSDVSCAVRPAFNIDLSLL
ncbi:MAG: hypothetical protein J6C53_03935 [Clostridia bacterium]|nr:hypothetical protein [Clostridia bacterium]